VKSAEMRKSMAMAARKLKEYQLCGNKATAGLASEKRRSGGVAAS
jgi:hypothetical protein